MFLRYTYHIFPHPALSIGRTFWFILISPQQICGAWKKMKKLPCKVLSRIQHQTHVYHASAGIISHYFQQDWLFELFFLVHVNTKEKCNFRGRTLSGDIQDTPSFVRIVNNIVFLFFLDDENIQWTVMSVAFFLLLSLLWIYTTVVHKTTVKISDLMHLFCRLTFIQYKAEAEFWYMPHEFADSKKTEFQSTRKV